jgi:DNA-binding CsgD family transcriptional regulator
LSPGQIECLLLVDQHHSSKEIAVQLGISPHTVDQRIRGALDKLGVERRGEAARLVAAASLSPTTRISAFDTSITAHRRRPANRHQEGAVRTSDSAR